jgi:photosystem II stability/assembly factor-like uncharacterized protein
VTRDAPLHPAARRISAVTTLGLALLVRACSCCPRDAWEAIEIGTDAEFEDICFVDERTGWMVGDNPFAGGGILGWTQNGGKTWSYRSGLVQDESGVMRYSLNAVHFSDPLHGCMAGDGGKILVTVDGGENWRQVRYGRGTSDHIFGLHLIDDREGWAVGLGGVLHTPDGGETWTSVGPQERTYVDVQGRAIHFVDRENGWVAGLHAGLWRTHDAGSSWTRVQLVPPTSDGSKLPYLFDMAWSG